MPDTWDKEAKIDLMMKWVMNIAVIAVIVLGIWLYQTHQRIEEQRVEFEAEYIQMAKEWEPYNWVLNRVHSGNEPPFWWIRAGTSTRYTSDEELESLADRNYSKPEPGCRLTSQ